MARIFDYLMLPKETTAVELAYARRVNRIALWVCWAHLPLFVAVALACGTSVAQALGIGAFLAAGPTIASRALSNPRHIGLVVGSTAMGLGALLVHLGQGAVQIEMHFHFFAALALLTVFGNPLVIWVAALTVALHHVLFWALWPKSVFNYDAAFWVVAVHAAFVVAESVAAAFIARNFYDNVIGLDKIVQERTRTIREILDNVTFGMFVTGKDLVVRGGHSRSSLTFLPGRDGALEGVPLTEALGLPPREAENFRGLYEQIFEADGLEDFALSQLPTRYVVGARTLGLSGSLIRAGSGAVSGVMFCVSDVTELVTAEREVDRTRSLLKIAGARARFRGVVDEARSVFSLLRSGLADRSRVEAMQRNAKTSLHTLKGNFGVYGLSELVELAHSLEEKEPLGKDDVTRLEAALKGVVERHFDVIGLHWDGADSLSRIEVSREELATLRDAVRAAIPDAAGRGRVDALLAEVANPTAGELTGPLEDLCAQLSARFGKKAVFRYEGSDLRMPEAFRPLFGTLTHLLRNAIDHGLETPSRRGSKAPVGTIALRVEKTASGYEVRFSDDGSGRDTEAIRAKAVEMGIVGKEIAGALTPQAVHELVFHPLFSTAAAVTDVSGRGLGMTAVRDELERLGGSIVIESAPGRGTTFLLRIPHSAAAGLLAAA